MKLARNIFHIPKLEKESHSYYCSARNKYTKTINSIERKHTSFMNYVNNI